MFYLKNSPLFITKKMRTRVILQTNRPNMIKNTIA